MVDDGKINKENNIKPIESQLVKKWSYPGKKVVEPGTRDVFAVLSLPPDYVGDDEYSGYVANVTATTRWRKYDSKSFQHPPHDPVEVKICSPFDDLSSSSELLLVRELMPYQNLSYSS